MDTKAVNEKTPIVPIGDPGPSYVFPGREPHIRERQAKQLQCFICAGIIASVLISLAIAFCYFIFGQDPSKFSTSNGMNESNQPRINLNDDQSLPTDFFILFPLLDEPIVNWTIPEPSQDELKEALDAGKKALGDREMLEEIIIAPVLNSPTYRHQRAVSTTTFARNAGKRGYVEDHATRFLAKKHDFKKNHNKLSIGIGPWVNLIDDEDIKCDENPKYRTIEGICNNKKHPRWGSAYIPFRRALNPDYCDAVSSPRCGKDGSELPSARDVSVTIHRPSYFTDKHFTVMLAVWGQFLDHDITATALSQSQDGEPIDCCSVSKQNMHPECFPVPLAKGDPYFNEYKVTCMNFVRSVPAPMNRLGPRQQYNQATGFIDGSVVYGSTHDKVSALRSFKYGKLEMYVTPDNRTLLPVSHDPNDGCNEAVENSKGRYCFDSGDARANENLHLTSLHLLFARHHNFLAEGLRNVNSHWSDEILFQEARKILGAQMQHITYNEFLSVIIGKDASENLGILSKPSSNEDTYDENVDPRIANEFAAAAFRFAHTLLPGLMKITKDLSDTEESIELHNMLFNPFSLYGPQGFDNALRSALNSSLEKSDVYFTPELTEKLFVQDASPVLCGLDLVSLNIQRGRDHGLRSYPEWRNHCHLSSVETWDEMETILDPQSFKRIREIYKTPQDVDLYTGGLAESPVKGGIIGATLTCIIGDQFLRMKKGDSFWYERTHGAQRFSSEQIHQIYETSLGSIICRNSDHVEYAQRYVMKHIGKTNPLLKCSEIDQFDFEPWREMTRVSMGDNDIGIKIIKH